MRFISHVQICEVSAVFFNLAFLLRLIPKRSSVINILISIFEFSFVVAFILTRCINLPLVMYAVTLQESETIFSLGKLTLGTVCLLQYFWLYKILIALRKKILGKKKDA